MTRRSSRVRAHLHHSWHYKPGMYVQLEDTSTLYERWFDTIHIVVDDPIESPAKVRTACGLLYFVGNVRPKRTAATCFLCIAAFL